MSEQDIQAIRERRARAKAATEKYGWMAAEVPTWAEVDILLALIDRLTAKPAEKSMWLEEAEAVAGMFPNFSWPDRLSFSEAVAEQLVQMTRLPVATTEAQALAAGINVPLLAGEILDYCDMNDDYNSHGIIEIILKHLKSSQGDEAKSS